MSGKFNLDLLVDKALEKPQMVSVSKSNSKLSSKSKIQLKPITSVYKKLSKYDRVPSDLWGSLEKKTYIRYIDTNNKLSKGAYVNNVVHQPDNSYLLYLGNKGFSWKKNSKGIKEIWSFKKELMNEPVERSVPQHKQSINQLIDQHTDQPIDRHTDQITNISNQLFANDNLLYEGRFADMENRLCRLEGRLTGLENKINRVLDYIRQQIN